MVVSAIIVVCYKMYMLLFYAGQSKVVKNKVAREFLQAAVKFKPVFLVNRDFRISLDRS